MFLQTLPGGWHLFFMERKALAQLCPVHALCRCPGGTAGSGRLSCEGHSRYVPMAFA